MPADRATAAFCERDLLVAPRGQFELHLSAAVAAADVALVIDVYDLSNPVHPAGHFGWWKFALEGAGPVVRGSIALDGDRLCIQIEGRQEIESWANATPPHGDRLLINAVLRANTTNAIVSMDRLPAFADASALSAFRQGGDRDWSRPRFIAPHFVPNGGETIHIVARDIYARDAVGNLCLDLYRLLKQNGIGAALHADHFDLALNDVIERKERLSSRVRAQDQLIYFYSTYEPQIAEIRDLPCARKTLYFHGVTDPGRLQAFDPEGSVLVARALADLPKLRGFDQFVANSTFNAERLMSALGANRVALGDIGIVPPKILAPTTTPDRSGFEKALMWVGRLKSHKKIDDVLRLFAAVHRQDPAVRAWIVGPSTDAAYRDYLRWVETDELELPADTVQWFGSIEQAQLDELYARAGLFVSMSEDEGFCLPVFEAMRSGLPVLAYGLPAVIEVLGGTGLYFAQKDFQRLAAMTLTLLGDQARWNALSAAQRVRAAELARAMEGRPFFDLIAPRPPMP